MYKRLTRKDHKPRVSSYEYVGVKEITKKLGVLEDIEEKIKCPLEVFFQIFRKGIYVKSDCTKGKIEFWHPQQIKIIDAGCQWDICKINSTTNKYVGCFNYKKTWALTKEELEND